MGTSNSQEPLLIGGSTDGTDAGASIIPKRLAAGGLDAHPNRAAAITLSDSTDVTATATQGIFVGTGGDVAVKFASDSTAVTLKNVPSGTYIPGAFSRIMSTNTTASNIVSFYGA